MIKANADDKHLLLPAFEGATVIFSNRDFFAHLFAPLSSPDSPAGRTLNEHAYDREIEQGVSEAMTWLEWTALFGGGVGFKQVLRDGFFVEVPEPLEK